MCEDEGLRHICNFIATCRNVNILEVLNNMITPLGCEFVGRILHPDIGSNITILKLDHNRFGSAGVN